MQDQEDELYRRWCRSADAGALGELFDSAAPRLLKVAVHVVGDAAEAEDLVQTCFMALIQQREGLDPARSVWPWLATVMQRKAIDLRRRRGWSAGSDSLEALVEPGADPAAPLERRELSAALAKAIDGLPEPFRQPAVLRLRHGLPVADIAHVLERSPSTVRVQLHRGRELLRAALPAGMTGALALLLPSTARGLGAVRVNVTAEAAAATAGVSVAGSSVLGAIMMSWKTLVVPAVALAALVIWMRRPSPEIEYVDGVGAQAQTALASPGEDAHQALLGASVQQSSEFRESAAPAATGLRVRVVDLDSGEPLAGVQLGLFEPRRGRLSEAAQDRPEFWRMYGDGQVRSVDQARWPQVHLDSEAVRFGAGDALFFDEPDRGQKPLAEAETDADGGADFPQRSAVLLLADHPGYLRRGMVLDPGEAELTLALGRARAIEGSVQLPDGSLPGVALHVSLTSLLRRPSVVEEGQTFQVVYFESTGFTAVDVSADGRFQAKVAADQVRARILTPGWKVKGPSTFSLQDEAPVRILVVPAPTLRFEDAVTGAAIERVRLVGREWESQYVKWSGEYTAPGGVLELLGWPEVLESWNEWGGAQFIAWAEGYRSAKVSIDRYTGPGEYVFRLPPGSTPELRGRVLRGGSPIEGAEVALVAHSPLQWGAGDEDLVDACTADRNGRFRVTAAPGTYVLRVRHGEDRHYRLADLPGSGEVLMDLDAQGEIQATIVDGSGEPLEQHEVMMADSTGRRELSLTDGAGVVRFRQLGPGRYTLATGSKPQGGQMTSEHFEPIDLGAGETAQVQAVVAEIGDTQVAHVYGAGADWEWWTNLNPAWEELGQAGRIELSRDPQAGVLELRSPDGQRWSCRVPNTEEFDIRIPTGNAELRGRVIEDKTGAFQGWRIYAREVDGVYDQPKPSTAIGADGSFAIVGLANALYSLHLHAPLSRGHTHDYTMGDYVYSPRLEAGRAPELTLDFRGAGEAAMLEGRVVRGPGKAPMRSAFVLLHCTAETSDGRLEFGREMVNTDADGSFRVETRAGVERVLTVYETWTTEGRVHEQALPADLELAGGVLEVVVEE